MTQPSAAGYLPPPEVSAAAAEGLTLQDRFGGGSIAVTNRARQLAGGEPLPRELVQRIADYHDNLSKAGGSEESCMSLLHGGAAGRAWVAEILNESARPPATLEKAVGGTLDPRSLRRQLEQVIASHPNGAPMEAFRDHVIQHGHKAIAGALHQLGATTDAGKVALTRRPPTLVGTVVRKSLDDVPSAPARSWRPLRFAGERP